MKTLIIILYSVIQNYTMIYMNYNKLLFYYLIKHKLNLNFYFFSIQLYKNVYYHNKQFKTANYKNLDSNVV